MLRRRFAPLKNAFACCAAVLYPCKMLSHAAPPFYTLAKCFRMLRRRFTPETAEKTEVLGVVETSHQWICKFQIGSHNYIFYWLMDER